MLNLSSTVVIYLWLALSLLYLYLSIPATCVLALLAWRASRKQLADRFSPPFAPKNIFYVSLFNAALGGFFFFALPAFQKQVGPTLFFAVCTLAAILFSALACWRPPSVPR